MRQNQDTLLHDIGPGDLERRRPPPQCGFFYLKNRLNVAVSWARVLAIILANLRLLELDAKTVGISK